MKIFPLFYFPPISFFVFLKQSENPVFELHQNYRKQKHTNRFHILTSNKVLPLSIPIRRNAQNTPIKDVRVQNVENWQHDHFRALECAYRSSPYFEFYEDYFVEFYKKRFDKLMDLNIAAMSLVLKILQMETDCKFTEKYEDSSKYEEDFRNHFDPKSNDFPPGYTPVEYSQVFGDNFTPELSILDLIFNLGPEARILISNSAKT